MAREFITETQSERGNKPPRNENEGRKNAVAENYEKKIKAPKQWNIDRAKGYLEDVMVRMNDRQIALTREGMSGAEMDPKGVMEDLDDIFNTVVSESEKLQDIKDNERPYYMQNLNEIDSYDHYLNAIKLKVLDDNRDFLNKMIDHVEKVRQSADVMRDAMNYISKQREGLAYFPKKERTAYEKFLNTMEAKVANKMADVEEITRQAAAAKKERADWNQLTEEAGALPMTAGETRIYAEEKAKAQEAQAVDEYEESLKKSRRVRAGEKMYVKKEKVVTRPTEAEIEAVDNWIMAEGEGNKAGTVGYEEQMANQRTIEALSKTYAAEKKAAAPKEEKPGFFSRATESFKGLFAKKEKALDMDALYESAFDNLDWGRINTLNVDGKDLRDAIKTEIQFDIEEGKIKADKESVSKRLSDIVYALNHGSRQFVEGYSYNLEADQVIAKAEKKAAKKRKGQAEKPVYEYEGELAPLEAAMARWGVDLNDNAAVQRKMREIRKPSEVAMLGNLWRDYQAEKPAAEVKPEEVIPENNFEGTTLEFANFKGLDLACLQRVFGNDTQKYSDKFLKMYTDLYNDIADDTYYMIKDQAEFAKISEPKLKKAIRKTFQEKWIPMQTEVLRYMRRAEGMDDPKKKVSENEFYSLMDKTFKNKFPKQSSINEIGLVTMRDLRETRMP